MQVDRDRGVVAVRDRPDDVLGPERRVAAEEHAAHASTPSSSCRPPASRASSNVEAEIALDPRKRIFLADRDQHVVAGEVDVGLAGRHELAPALGVLLRRDLLERDAGQLAVLVRERLGHEDSCGSGCPRAPRPPSPTATPSSRRSRSARRPARPRRRAGATLRQQSIAVLPPPSTTTRLPIFVVWPNDTLDEPVDADVDVRRRLARGPGTSRSRPRGAPLPTKTASHPSASSACRLSMRWPGRNSTPRSST